MKTSGCFVLAFTIALLSAGCGRDTNATAPAPKFDLAAAKKVIAANTLRFTQAHVTGDKATIDNMVTRDAKCYPPNADPVIGRDAIAVLNAEYISYGITEFTEVSTDFYGNEDVLIDEGSYVLVYGPEKTRETGNFVNIWKQEDGVWKMSTNIWNTNTPVPPAK